VLKKTDLPLFSVLAQSLAAV